MSLQFEFQNLDVFTAKCLLGVLCIPVWMSAYCHRAFGTGRGGHFF